jgi:hypothetical protein
MRPHNEREHVKNPKVGDKVLVIKDHAVYIVELKSHHINGKITWMVMVPGMCLDLEEEELYVPLQRDLLEYEQEHHSRV